jgi:hypothetical protein
VKPVPEANVSRCGMQFHAMSMTWARDGRSSLLPVSLLSLSKSTAKAAGRNDMKAEEDAGLAGRVAPISSRDAVGDGGGVTLQAPERESQDH